MQTNNCAISEKAKERLTEAVISLAAVITEIAAEAARQQVGTLAQGFDQRPAQKSVDTLLTKQELADKLKVGIRTITEWMDRRRLPYYKLGKNVRFSWSEVESSLKAFRIGGLFETR